MIEVDELEGRVRTRMTDPPIARLLFQSTGPVTWVWLAVRLWLGWTWLQMGWAKLADPRVIEAAAGRALAAWQATLAVSPTAGGPTDALGRTLAAFLLANHAEYWLTTLVGVGEILAAVAVAVGAGVGIAATFGLLLDLAAILLGAPDPDSPLALGLAILLILAWKNAGYLGLDRVLLRRFVSPWRHPDTLPVPRRRPPAPAR